MPGKRLTVEDRATIERGYAAGMTFEQLGVVLGRPRSTIWREVQRNHCFRHGPKSGLAREPDGRRRRGYVWGYQARRAQRSARRRARRPKVPKLAPGQARRELVLVLLGSKWSPEQIAAWLRMECHDQPELWVSHETIYQAIYVQGRGGLRDELKDALRTGRAHRRPQGRLVRAARSKGSNRPWITEPMLISERPAAVEDRAVPGHWEGDLIIGARCASGIATLVERSSRYTLLVALPDGDRSAGTVCSAIADKMLTLPGHLRRSLTWDQGVELAAHAQFSVATDAEVYFCDPHAPWQRGSNENTNGLLRQYFPKSTFDFRTIDQTELDRVAHELNTRPRKTLGWKTPAWALNAHLVATAA